MRILVALLILLTLCISPAAAKSKAEVGDNCLSQHAARAAWPGVYLKYRVIDARRCWYAPGHKMIAKKPVRVAAVAPKTAPRPVPERVMALAPDNLARAKEVLCGGPCPRFDLDASADAATFRALCGGPCPDFRHRVFDDVFDSFARGSR